MNALYFLPILLTKKNRRYLNTVAEGKHLPSLKEFASMTFNFGLTLIAWFFFRSDNIWHAISYISNLFLGLDEIKNYSDSYFYLYKIGYPFLLCLVLFITIEWLGRKSQYAIEQLIFNKLLRWIIYLIISILIISYIGQKTQEFIYFQF